MRGERRADAAATACTSAGTAATDSADMRLDHAMRQALASGRFRLQYQPQVDLSSGRIVGAEALIRWRDPELGEVPPAQLHSGGRGPASSSPSATGCSSRRCARPRLARAGPGDADRDQRVGAAVPAARFIDRVASVLQASGLPPQLLELELTESILVRDAEEALQRLQSLARLGVRLAIDDFGTGYSSLAYLKRFPIDKLKIDRSFVHGLPADDSDAAIVRAILQMAAALGMKVIAEGVETEAQRRFLLDSGCHEFQGYLHAPALDSLSFAGVQAARAGTPRIARRSRTGAQRLRVG
jgi:EAL domain-containing protein (putative c-di-GMP-specific phosphodiesterase class I)